MCSEARAQALVERMQVRMQAWVAIIQVRILYAENLRFLQRCSSAGG